MVLEQALIVLVVLLLQMLAVPLVSLLIGRVVTSDMYCDFAVVGSVAWSAFVAWLVS